MQGGVRIKSWVLRCKQPPQYPGMVRSVIMCLSNCRRLASRLDDPPGPRPSPPTIRIANCLQGNIAV